MPKRRVTMGTTYRIPLAWPALGIPPWASDVLTEIRVLATCPNCHAALASGPLDALLSEYECRRFVCGSCFWSTVFCRVSGDVGAVQVLAEGLYYPPDTFSPPNHPRCR